MPVTSSTAAFDGPVQADGRRWVREAHTHPGGEVVLNYLGTPGDDIAARASVRVASINESLADNEARENMDRDGAPNLGEMTLAQFAARFRERYRNADRDEACRMAYWLTRRIAAGHITDAQCRSAFGVTNTQWTIFKTNKLTPQHDAWAAVIAATGG